MSHLPLAAARVIATLAAPVHPGMARIMRMLSLPDDAFDEHFDGAAEFEATGAQRVGISADDVDRQARFDERNTLGFPLLSDPSRAVAAEFGVKRPLALMNKRSTFVIDTDSRILAVISSELNFDVHADEALAVLRARTS